MAFILISNAVGPEGWILFDCILHAAHALEVLKSNTREYVSCMFKCKISVGLNTKRKQQKKKKKNK